MCTKTKRAIAQPKGNAEFPVLTAKEDADFFRNAEGSEMLNAYRRRIRIAPGQSGMNGTD
jgi:hypothetical protein